MWEKAVAQLLDCPEPARHDWRVNQQGGVIDPAAAQPLGNLKFTERCDKIRHTRGVILFCFRGLILGGNLRNYQILIDATIAEPLPRSTPLV
jgi:hypothetical protein